MVFKKIPLLRRMENAHYSTSDLKYIYLPTAKEKEDHPKKYYPTLWCITFQNGQTHFKNLAASCSKYCKILKVNLIILGH